MKFLKFLVSFIQKIIGFVNIFLILIIVLNLVNIIASKVQDNSYISFLGYTYVNIESDNKELDLEKGDLDGYSEENEEDNNSFDEGQDELDDGNDELFEGLDDEGEELLYGNDLANDNLDNDDDIIE